MPVRMRMKTTVTMVLLCGITTMLVRMAAEVDHPFTATRPTRQHPHSLSNAMPPQRHRSPQRDRVMRRWWSVPMPLLLRVVLRSQPRLRGRRHEVGLVIHFIQGRCFFAGWFAAQ
jgi:hypothetical protein